MARFPKGSKLDREGNVVLPGNEGPSPYEMEEKLTFDPLEVRMLDYMSPEKIGKFGKAVMHFLSTAPVGAECSFTIRKEKEKE